MKKYIIIALIAAIGGFCLWFFSPSQQLKRKSEKAIELLTVDPTNGQTASTADLVMVDTIFSDPFTLISVNPTPEQKKMGLATERSLNLDSLRSAVKSMSAYLKKLTHDCGEFSITKVSDTSYEVVFDHVCEIKSSKVTTTINSKTTFLFEKTNQGLRLSKVILKNK